MTDTIMKRCSKCGRDFPATKDYFNTQNSQRGSLRPDCKECSRERDARYRAANLNQVSEKNARYRAEHADDAREYQTRYRAEHVDKIRRRDARYRTKNADKIRESKARHRAEHADEVHKRDARYRAKRVDKNRDYQKRYRAEHPDAVRIADERRRAIERGLPASFDRADWRFALEYFGGRCAVCGRAPDFWHCLAQEHWIAVVKGGPFTVDNIVPMCHSRPGAPIGDPGCNNSKSARDPIEWLYSAHPKHKADKILVRIETYFAKARNRKTESG